MRLPADWRRLAGAGAAGYLLGRHSGRRRHHGHLLVALAFAAVVLAIVAALAWAVWPYVIAGAAVAAAVLFVRREARHHHTLAPGSSTPDSLSE
ncbi:MAG: hypothetical protein ACRDZ6_02350 [Acidimicrobiales bacterium]